MRRVTDRPAVVLLIVSLGVVLSSLDLFIANVALPEISADLHPSDLGELSWVLNSYAIVFAALLVPAGRIADRTSHRTGYLLGVGIFIVASAACAAATNVPMLIAFRVVQAIGAALLVPTSLGLVLAAYPPERRGGAVRIWSVVGTAAVAVAPVVAGPLVEVSWRWVFLINLPIGLVALVAGWLKLPHTQGDKGPVPDGLGAAVLTAAIAALTLALVKGGDWGWASVNTLGLLVGSAVLLVAFFARSARHASPVFEIGLLRNRSFALASTTMLLASAAFGGMLLSAVLWVQQVWGWSPLAAGFAIAPGPLMVPFCANLVGKLIPKLGPGKVVVIGAVIFAGGLFWWAAAADIEAHYASGLLGGMIMTGIGFGLMVPTLFGSAAGSLPPQRFATGSGIINMVRQIGITVGVAALVAILGTPDSMSGQLDAFRHAWYAFAGISLLAALAGVGLPRPKPPVPAPAPPKEATVQTH